MPDIFFPITEIAANMLDPIISQVSEAVLRRLGVRDYFANNIYINTNRSTASLSGDGEGNINLSRNRCDITVEDMLNPANVIWDRTTTNNQTAYGSSPLYRVNYQAIFHDPVAKVRILEHTMPAALAFNFKLRFLSHDAAGTTFAALLGQQHGNAITMVHDLVYGYPVTLRMLIALSTVHTNRQSFSADFNAYLKNYSTVYWHRVIRKLDLGTTPEEFQLTVQRQQLRCQALLEFSQNGPDVERIGGIAQCYNIEFTYRMQFGRPNMLQLVVPCVVENNALPEALFPRDSLNAIDFLQNRLQEKSFALAVHEMLEYRPPLLLTRLPHYDDFTPAGGGMLETAKYHSFISASFTLDLPGPTVISFASLDVYRLHPIVIDIIKLHSSDDLLGYQGLFNLTVFADTLPLDPSLLTVDPLALTVSIHATILTKNYHLVLSEAGDLRWVLPKWYPVLLQYRFFFPMTIERNLNILLKDNAIQITADADLIGLVTQLMQRNRLDGILQQWIQCGETTYEIYSYTRTAMQFADYISLTKAYRTPHKTLYDLFITACLEANYITESLLPGRSLRTPVGYPYGPNQGGFYGFNIPLRVLNITLQPEHPG